MSHVIEVSNLQKEYKGGHKALKGITFHIEKGEIFGILGPNGAGKTTTLEILETIRKASGGSAKILGFHVSKEAGEIKKRIGVQLQSSDYLPSLTLRELLVLFASFHKNNSNPDELLEFVNLTDKKDQEVSKLSGGQKQRFTIATSLVHKPEILFLDEPTTGLDPSARRNLWSLVRKLRDRGITIVLTTHYMEEAEFLCDRVAILDQGQILKINDPRTLINDLSHTTQISFFTEQEVAKEKLQNLPGVGKIFSNYPKVILEISSLDHIGKVLEGLKSSNIIFSGFTVKTATLEDVYLDLTGHEFES